MAKIFVVLVLLISSDSFSQSGWFTLTSGTNYNLNDIYFINENTGWIVGDSAVILMTTNGGINWNIQRLYSEFYPNLRTVNFVNSSTGYAGGGGYWNTIMQTGKKTLFKTTNQGLSWFESYSYIQDGYIQFTSISVMNSNVLFISTAGQFSTGGSFGLVEKSTNSGVNFIPVNGLSAHFSLSFINEQTGWTSSYYIDDMANRKSYVLKTSNSGLNWVTQYKDTISPVRLNKIQFVDFNTGYGVGENIFSSPHYTKFFKTTNSGDNWNIFTITNTHKSSSLFFLDANTGWICGSPFEDSSAISKTTNGGQTWISQRKGVMSSINNIFFINSVTGYGVGYNGLIIKTTTGGILGLKEIKSVIPLKYSLSQNYPNPFNSSSNFRFEISRHGGSSTGNVKITVYDVQGREMQTLVNERLSAGTYEVKFDGSMLTSGVYFYKMVTEGFSETRMMLLIK